jgi:prepilin-type processing-associated H-X9-DG protein
MDAVLSFDANFPPNPQRYTSPSSLSGEAVYEIASSFHPGGGNVAFADGSAKFIKDTVNSWPLVPNGQGGVMVPSSYYTLNFVHRNRRDLQPRDAGGRVAGPRDEGRRRDHQRRSVLTGPSLGVTAPIRGAVGVPAAPA